jgi:hypothetical protein
MVGFSSPCSSSVTLLILSSWFSICVIDYSIAAVGIFSWNSPSNAPSSKSFLKVGAILVMASIVRQREFHLVTQGFRILNYLMHSSMHLLHSFVVLFTDLWKPSAVSFTLCTKGRIWSWFNASFNALLITWSRQSSWWLVDLLSLTFLFIPMSFTMVMAHLSMVLNPLILAIREAISADLATPSSPQWIYRRAWTFCDKLVVDVV